MQKPKNEEKTKIARRLAKEVFVTGVPMQKTYDGDSVSSDGRFQHLFKPHKGMVLFFLNSSISNIIEFTSKFTYFSKLPISGMPKYRCSEADDLLPQDTGTINISYDEWKQKKEAGEICVLYEHESLCAGFDKG